MAPSSPKTILFLLLNPGYAWFYDSTLRALAGEGHRIRLAFDQALKKADGIEAFEAIGGRLEIDPAPDVRQTRA